jgi:hypothetical protein
MSAGDPAFNCEFARRFHAMIRRNAIAPQFKRVDLSTTRRLFLLALLMTVHPRPELEAVVNFYSC